MLSDSNMSQAMVSEQQNWEPCPAGELTKMVEAQRARARRKVVDRVAVAAAGVMACIAIGGYTLGLFTPEAPSGVKALTCSEVLPQLSTYADGGLSESARGDIAAHLQKCPSCRTRYEELLESVSRIALPSYLFALASF